MKDGVKSISFSSWANVLFHTGKLNCWTVWLNYRTLHTDSFIYQKIDQTLSCSTMCWAGGCLSTSPQLLYPSSSPSFYSSILSMFSPAASDLYLSLSFCHSVYSHFYFFITRKMMEWSFDDRAWCYHSPCYQSLPPFAAWLLNHTPVHSTFICLNCHCPSWSLLDRPISSNEGN